MAIRDRTEEKARRAAKKSEDGGQRSGFTRETGVEVLDDKPLAFEKQETERATKVLHPCIQCRHRLMQGWRQRGRTPSLEPHSNEVNTGWSRALGRQSA